MVAHPQSTGPQFHRKAQRLRHLSLIETQLRKAVKDLCVNDVLERVAEVDMSISNLVRSEPLLDWLQPIKACIISKTVEPLKSTSPVEVGKLGNFNA